MKKIKINPSTLRLRVDGEQGRTIKNFGFYIIILVFVFCIYNLTGCASFKETVKGIAGVSTKALEEGRKDAIKKTFNYDYFTTYTKTLDILKDIGAYIYTQNVKKYMIAIYVSEKDTTPVGIFFKEIDAIHTQIEVSSPSLSAKGLVSVKLFSALEKDLPQK